MSTSFFEKLTGALNEEAEEIEAPEKEKKKPAVKRKRKTTGKTRLAKSERAIKKESLKMSKAETQPKAKERPMKKTKPKEIEPEIEEKEKPSIAEAIEGKNWPEEAEGEEGQLTIDVYQTDSDIVVKSTIAGVKPEDIDISIANDMITIKGRRTKDEKIEAENYYYQELYWGAFSRSIILPVEVDADRARATIKNGVLTINLPKAEKIKAKKIKVRTLE